MEHIYYSAENPSGFAGVTALQQATGKPIRHVKQFLNQQPTYRRFKTPRKPKRARVIVPSMAVQFEGDLFDLTKYSRQNKGFKWILLIVDSFSRRVECEPLRSKAGPEVARGLDVIFSRLSSSNLISPNAYFATDCGNEFFNQNVEVIYKKFNLSHFPLRAPIKCAFAEITGRYIVTRLHKIMFRKETKCWIDHLQTVVLAKNSRKNKKTAGLSPDEINSYNQMAVKESLYPEQAKPKFTLQIGDIVQVVKNRNLFAKSFHGYYSDKLYRVTKLHDHTVPRYTITDEEDGETIAGTWYAAELYLMKRRNTAPC